MFSDYGVGFLFSLRKASIFDVDKTDSSFLCSTDSISGMCFDMQKGLGFCDLMCEKFCCKVMCRDYLQERKELVEALHKGRRFANLPEITQVFVHSDLSIRFNFVS